ncbi:ATP-binding cassette domain-containing protein [Cellulomonas sp. IC4_254]|uniref:ABC transporter ATP-binding protein n=1 Tax=Cellulomonas sp. IC4_254 TaxID=2714040 RepID=UPI001421FB0C|nr:ATP-binding cassette domain-containing protein [Cellulomonas sp. IC4_254]NHT17224.1 ATP-binding cassette domain-containing protein [Cellulomonas sp. IC4_254]
MTELVQPLRVRGLSCAVPGRTLFANLDLDVEAGSAVAILGPSGSGKSTLLSTLLGLRPIERGDVTVCGTQLRGLPRAKASRLRRDAVGIVFQDGALLPELTAAENVAVAAMMTLGDPSAAASAADAALAKFGVPPDTLAGDLSGGERQRTAVARALANEPRLVLADEPTGSLDHATRDDVAEILFGVPRSTGCGLLIVTHDPSVAARADRAVRLGSDGLVAV